MSILLAAMLMQTSADEIDQLCARLGDDDIEVREAATDALQAMGRPALRAALRLRESSDPEVRGRAMALVRDLKRAFEKDALKLDVKWIDAAAQVFEARVANVEEFDVEVAASISRRPPAAIAQAGQFGGLDFSIAPTDCLETVRVVIRPGESIDVTKDTHLSFVERGGVRASVVLGAGAHQITAAWSPPEETARTPGSAGWGGKVD